MTYDEALGFWYGRINYEVRAAKPGDMKLERMRALLKLLGDPHDRVRLVRTSRAARRARVPRVPCSPPCCAPGTASGCLPRRTSNTSKRRIRWTACRSRTRSWPRGWTGRGRDAPPRPERPADHVLRDRQTAPDSSTCYRRCEVAVIEVGLGGRFDSTNVCNPVVSVITNVGFDHMAQLGDTLEEIAYQKAGIIKRRVPVVNGVTQDGPREVVRKIAAEVGAPLGDGDGFPGGGNRTGPVDATHHHHPAPPRGCLHKHRHRRRTRRPTPRSRPRLSSAYARPDCPSMKGSAAGSLDVSWPARVR